MALVTPPSTPRSSRPFIGRILRSHTKNRRIELDDETPRITSFFNVRKRLSSSFPDKCEEVIGKKRTNIITGVRAVTPKEPYPSDTPSPLFRMSYSGPRPKVPSPSKRPCESSALGVFDSMGTHEIHGFMSFMPMEFFINLALSSREWSTCVTKYVETATFRKQFVALTNDHEMGMNINDPFIDAGELLKSLTVSRLPSDRVDKLLEFVESCHDQVNTQEGWGRLIRKFSERWAYHEMAKIVRAFKNIGNGRFTKLMRTAVRSTPGVNAESEMEVRRLARCFFLEPLCRNNNTSSEKRMSAFWLSSILRSLTSIQCQGRFCMIVFGPTATVDGVERVNWRDLVENPVGSAAQAEKNLKPLATAISALSSLRDHCDNSSSAFVWRQDEIFNLIEEITTFPDPWSFDNFVALLMQKSSLLPVAVCTRIIHGHRDEAGQIINSMKTLLYRWNMDVAQALGRPFRYILNQLDIPNRRTLLTAIFESHVSQCRDLLFGNGGQASYDEEMWAHQAFLPLMFEASDSMR